MARTKKNTQQVAGIICLYGASKVGFDYIARAHDGRMFGKGEPRIERGLNDAMWLGCRDLRDAGYRGAVIVYEPCGRAARIEDVTHPPIFGDLTWNVAPTTYVISADEILKNSTPAK